MSNWVPVAMHIAVIAHVFYVDAWPEMRRCISSFYYVCGQDSVDVLLTYPDSRPELKQSLIDCFPRAQVECVENKGYDVAPFFLMLNKLRINDYDYVVKIHSKRDIPCRWVNFHPYRGGEWRAALLSFCSSPASVRRTLQALGSQPDLGMVVGRGLVDPTGVQEEDKNWGSRQIASLGLKPNGHMHVSGTMFIVRASLLRPAWRQVSFDDFTSVSNPHYDYGLAGDWEGAFPLLVTSQGMRISDGRHSKLLTVLIDAHKFVFFHCVRFASRTVRKLVGGRGFDAILGLFWRTK